MEIRLKQSYWYFPGDPPVFDFLLDIGIFILTVSILVFLITFLLRGQRRQITRWISLAVAGFGVVVAIPGVVVVGYRHSDAWETARTAIRHYDRMLSEAILEQGLEQPLSTEDFARLRAAYLPDDRVIYLKGWKQPVRLRMAHGVAPYVGLDFGGGATALFEPGTMRCMYSD